jgi:integrase
MPKGSRGTGKPYLRGSTWWIKYSVPGESKPRYESTNSTNKTDAIRLLNKRRSEIDNRQVTPANVLVSDLLDLYLADQRKQARHSYKQAEGYVRLHLKPAFGEVKASTITTGGINRFIEQKQNADYANATINRWLEALRRSYALGAASMPPLVHAAPKIDMLVEDNVREGFLEHDQYLVLRNELPDHQRLILVIGYHLGMRRGEILNLRWDQVDWQENLIRLERKQTKGKQARVAPLYGELRAWLDMAASSREESCPFIVTWRGEQISEIKTAWNKARVRAKVPRLLVHDLRRTAVRNMIRAGVPEKQAMRISGHKSRSMFDRYDITDERDIQIAGQKLARYLEGKAEVVTKEVTVAKNIDSRKSQEVQ